MYPYPGQPPASLSLRLRSSTCSQRSRVFRVGPAEKLHPVIRVVIVLDEITHVDFMFPITANKTIPFCSQDFPPFRCQSSMNCKIISQQHGGAVCRGKTADKTFVRRHPHLYYMFPKVLRQGARTVLFSNKGRFYAFLIKIDQ